MRYLIRMIYGVLIFILANSYSLGGFIPVGAGVWLLFLLFVGMNVAPSFANRKLQTGRLRVSADGCELLELFLISTGLSIVYSLAGWSGWLPLGSLLQEPKLWIVNTLIVFLVEAVVFWNGMIRIYVTSVQLGIKWRVIGALCGWIPILNLVVLMKMIDIVRREVATEQGKILEAQEYREEERCRTKYPLLMVHGVFFRDFKHFNYWGRIPGELEKNGACIYYGNHASASSVEDSGVELDARIRQIVEETGCEKVNIIAHSKGGLDCRYALSRLGTDRYVASLTTINTPHRGCQFADYLLSQISESKQRRVASAYNAALAVMGDEHPDFLAAVGALTEEACRKRNEELPDSSQVYYQSVGSKLNRPSGGRFPLNFSYYLVKHFDGANDGLVGEESFPWGEKFQLAATTGRRGISHGDMIDLNRENFDGFDVREFYVELVHELKKKGF
ncbi:MAG: triacylglycerol lipase [Lachnospiraceae bacterium]|nr:triacylglycerol lipase [Lachnospiraceae bacterium]